MKEITLQIQDEHYEIIEHFAELYGKPIEDYVLIAARSSISATMEAEEVGDDLPDGFGIHKRLGGDDWAAAPGVYQVQGLR